MSNPLSPDPSQNLLPSTSFSALNWNPQEPNPVVVLQSDLLIGHINQNPNITAVTPNPSDSLLLAPIEGSIATIDPNITLPNDNSFDGLTGEAMDIVKEQLTQFAKVPNFVEKMNLAFGESWDTQAANVLTQDWLNGDFSLIPPVKFVSSAEIGGANGAFAAATDTIYLSRELLTENGANPATVADVLLEEIGHSVDSRLNVTDSPGDEGAIFAGIVQGNEWSHEELVSLKSQEDSLLINLHGQDISIEQAFDYDNRWSVWTYKYDNSGKTTLLKTPSGYSNWSYKNTLTSGDKGFSQNWGLGSPVSSKTVPKDYVQLSLLTKADFEQGQTYEFKVTADDFYWLTAIPANGVNSQNLKTTNGQELITQWKWNSDAYNTKTIQFVPKQTGKYWIRAGYREKTGAAALSISWEKAQQQNPILNTQSPQYFRDRPQFYMQQGNGYAQYGYGSSVLGNNSYGQEGNCTWYAYGRLKELGFNPNDIMNGYPNAYEWLPLRNGSRVLSTGETPRLGDVAQWYLNGLNHVAIVEKVENGYVWLSESNWGTDKDGDMDGDGRITGDGTVHKIVQYTVNNPHRYIRLTKT